MPFYKLKVKVVFLKAHDDIYYSSANGHALIGGWSTHAQLTHSSIRLKADRPINISASSLSRELIIPIP